MAGLSPQFESTQDIDLEVSEIESTINELHRHTVLLEVQNSVDEMLAMTAGHQIVSASEMTDKLLDLRILVSKLTQPA